MHLVGTPHPSPKKAAEFRRVDVPSIVASVEAARRAHAAHLVYVSVAHPAPVMRAYIAARVEAEEAIRGSGMSATILRPWYVLGPGRRWPMLLGPILRRVSPRLALVTVEQMIAALAGAVDDPPNGIRILEVPEIRGLPR